MTGNQWGSRGGDLSNPFVGEADRQRKRRTTFVIGGAAVAVLVVVGLILAFALGRGSGGEASADACDGPVSGTADRPAELTDAGWEGTSAMCAGDDPWFYAAPGFHR